MRTPADLQAPTSGDDAKAAAASAAANLEESVRRWPSVRRIAGRLDEELATNHLGARIQETYRSR